MPTLPLKASHNNFVIGSTTSGIHLGQHHFVPMKKMLGEEKFPPDTELEEVQ